MPEKIARPELTAESMRIAVDSVFDCGSVRIAYAKRKKRVKGDRSDAGAWLAEREETLITDHIEKALEAELKGRELREGDVLLIANGDQFLARMKGAKGAAADGKTVSIAPERLVMPLGATREAARQEIKREYAKLANSRGVLEEKARRRLISQADRARKDEFAMRQNLGSRR